MSVPKRIMLKDIPATSGNQHTLTFNHRATKNGKHAYDFLTSWSQAVTASNAIGGPNVLVNLNNCEVSIGPPNSLSQLCASLHSGPNSISVDIPGAGSGIAYVNGLGAGSITGDSFRMKLATLDGTNLGRSSNTSASATVLGYRVDLEVIDNGNGIWTWTWKFTNTGTNPITERRFPRAVISTASTRPRLSAKGNSSTSRANA